MFRTFLPRRAVPMLGAVAMLALVPLGVADASTSTTSDDYDDAPRTVLRSSLVGNLPSDPALFGVLPGTNPWVIKRGRVRLQADGQLSLKVRGLVIPTASANGTNPVPTLSASVFCGGTLVALTATVPFSRSGDARLERDIGDLPSPCLAPAVFVHPNAITARYIAFNGSR